MNDIKEKKANERSNRIIIKGRKVMEHGFINKVAKIKENLEKKKDETDEKFMLYFDDI